MRLTQKISQFGTLEKIIATGGVLLGGAAIVAAGAFATFTSTGQATVGADAGELNVKLTTGFTVRDMAPGDTVYSLLPIDLPDTGAGGNLLSALGMYIDSGALVDRAGHDPDVSSGTTTNDAKLLADVHGLTFVVKTCSQPWTAALAGNGPPTCDAPATETTANPTRTSTGAAGAIGKLGNMVTPANMLEYVPADLGALATTGGLFETGQGDVKLNTMIALSLPVAADNNYQNAWTSFNFVVAAIQRSGVTR
jgi:hypothetical protein